MKYFSMFSGIGGFELGIQRATNNAYECVGFSEIDKYAIATYEKHFGGHKNYGNAKTINPGTLPNFDLLVGGFPCQTFSIAGKRKGFEDTRGTLFFDIARIVKVKKPKMLLLENVKGLLNHDKGSTFAKILETLWELGYDVEWCVLNSKNFGVPQNRERVFIIGHLEGFGGQKIFPIERENETRIKEYPPICGSSQKHAAVMKGLVPCLSTAMGIGGGQIPMKFENPEISYALDSNYYKGTKLENYYKKKRRQIVANPEIRRLTPIECERLQGFPDNWTIGSDTQRYKQCGNAVTVNVIEYVMGLILNTQIHNDKKEMNEK